MPSEVSLNAPFTYSLLVTNQTTRVANNVVVQETLAPNFKLLGSSPQARVNGGTAIWSLGAIGAGTSREIRVRGQATTADPLVQCSTLTACTVTHVVQPQLLLTKTIPSDALICETIPMKLAVRNMGDGTAQNVVIRDELPANLTSVDGAKILSFNAGTLAAGQSREFTANLKALRTGKYDNVATATSAEGLSVKSTPVSVTVRQPVLEITKKAPANQYLGKPIRYRITVTNKGDAPAQDLVISDTLPSNMTFVNADNGGTLVNGNVEWRLPPLAPGQSRSVMVTYEANRSGTFRNQAIARAACAEPVSDSAQTSVTGIAAILLEVVDIEDPIEVGANETYLITTTNQGSSDGTNIRIVCTLEDSMRYASSEGPTLATVQDQTISFAPLLRLAPKDKATWKVVVRAAKMDDARFRVTLTSDQLRRPVEETESTHIYE